MLSIFRKKEKTIKQNAEASSPISCNMIPYKKIPIYSEMDFMAARATDLDEDVHVLMRQVMNGYASIFDDWIVGKDSTGSLIKTKKIFSFSSDANKEGYIRKVNEVANKAFSGADVSNLVFCKFTYALKDQKLFSTHVDLQQEYIPGVVYHDCGSHVGIHFVGIDNISLCLKDHYTKYGNKVAILRTCDDTVYYEYLKDTYVGPKVFVEKVLDMDLVETWKFLAKQTDSIYTWKNSFIEYLSTMNDGKDYTKAIQYLQSLGKGSKSE